MPIAQDGGGIDVAQQMLRMECARGKMPEKAAKSESKHAGCGAQKRWTWGCDGAGAAASRWVVVVVVEVAHAFIRGQLAGQPPASREPPWHPTCTQHNTLKAKQGGSLTAKQGGSLKAKQDGTLKAKQRDGSQKQLPPYPMYTGSRTLHQHPLLTPHPSLYYTLSLPLILPLILHSTASLHFENHSKITLVAFHVVGPSLSVSNGSPCPAVDGHPCPK